MSDIITIIICLTIGIILIALRKNSMNPVVVSIIGLIFVVIGLLVGFQKIYGDNEFTTIILMWLMCGSFGGSMVYAGAYGVYEKIFLCTNETNATVVEVTCRRAARGRREYYPVVTYYVKKKKYKTKCCDSFGSEKSLSKRYEIGKEYPAYVSVKNPRMIVLNRKKLMAEIIMICVGLSILSVAVWYTFTL